jgi:hypothetical protein
MASKQSKGGGKKPGSYQELAASKKDLQKKGQGFAHEGDLDSVREINKQVAEINKLIEKRNKLNKDTIYGGMLQLQPIKKEMVKFRMHLLP